MQQGAAQHILCSGMDRAQTTAGPVFALQGTVVLPVALQPGPRSTSQSVLSSMLDCLLQAPSDLILSKSISLSEALTGLHFHVRHLDGRVLQVRAAAVSVAKSTRPWLCTFTVVSAPPPAAGIHRQ